MERFKDCVFSEEPSHYDPEDVAGALSTIGVRDPRAIFILREAILKEEPRSISRYVDAICFAFGSDQEIQMLLESVIITIAAEVPTWSELVSAEITPDQLFSAASTQGPVMVTTMLAARSRDLERFLQEGARGEWGGTASVISRALSSATWLLRDDPESAQQFLVAVHDSASRPLDGEFGGLLAALLSMPQHYPKQDATLNCQCLLEILQDPNYRLQAARQLHGMYGLNIPQHVSPIIWEPIREEVKLALQL